jgi:hypothetical protein
MPSKVRAKGTRRLRHARHLRHAPGLVLIAQRHSTSAMRHNHCDCVTLAVQPASRCTSLHRRRHCVTRMSQVTEFPDHSHFDASRRKRHK